MPLRFFQLAAPLLALLAWMMPVAGAVEVRVDPRVEFAAVMCRLAGLEEFQSPGFADYDAAVDAHFAPFRDHPSVAVVRALRQDVRLGYNMPAELAVATGEGDWRLRLPAGDPANGLDARWTPEAAQRFLEAARVLWEDSDAGAFFAGQRAFHQQVEQALAADLGPRLDLTWFERQYGESADRRFTVIAGLLNGPHSYGPHLVLPGGHVEAFAILGTPAHEAGQAPSYPADQAASLLVHEVHHPFVNPWVAAHADQLAPGASRLYAQVEADMKAAAYGQWDYMLNESLVRAQVLRYYRAHGAMGPYWRNLRDDRRRGFAWVDALADAIDAAVGALGGFDERAEAAVFDFFARWGADPAAMIAAEDARQAARQRLRRAEGVQLLSASPALDDGVVAPGEGELRLEFDRPMGGSVALSGDAPEVIGTPRWEQDGRVLVVPVRFAAGGRHVLQLNDEIEPGQGFRGKDGQWLVPREWRFTVRANDGE